MKTSDHLLVVSGEEAVELAEASVALQEITTHALRFSQHTAKSLRFGPHEINPVLQKTPVESLVCEMNDLIAAVEMLQEAGIELPGLGDREYIEQKKQRIKKMMAVSATRCLLEPPSPPEINAKED